MNSGQPVALSMMVSAWMCSVVDFPGIAVELKLTVHGPIKSTWTTSQGATFLLVGRGIFPYFFTAVILYFWQIGPDVFIYDCVNSRPVKVFYNGSLHAFYSRMLKHGVVTLQYWST